MYKIGKVDCKAHFASLIVLGVALKCSGDIDATVRKGGHCERTQALLKRYMLYVRGWPQLVA